MNREIKLRAWNKDMKHMVFPSLEFGREIWPCFYKKITTSETDEKGKTVELVLEMVSVDHILQSQEFEVMQFTSLKDKNGKEIYEGDYIGYYYDGELISGVVTWENAMFVVKEVNWDYEGKKQKPDPLSEWIEEGIEILGNVFENPEILQP